MMQNLEMTSGEVSLFLGSTRADIRGHSMCLHSGLRTSVKSRPLHLCPPWPLDVPPSITENRRGCKRFSALSFSAPFQMKGVVSRRQFVNKHRWCKGSGGTEREKVLVSKNK